MDKKKKEKWEGQAIPAEALANFLAPKLQNAVDKLPGGEGKWGFCLMIFPFGDEEGSMSYISNTQRRDMLAALKYFVKFNEKILKSEDAKLN